MTWFFAFMDFFILCLKAIDIELTWSFAFMALSVIDSWQLAQVIVSAILEKWKCYKKTKSEKYL